MSNFAVSEMGKPAAVALLIYVSSVVALSYFCYQISRAHAPMFVKRDFAAEQAKVDARLALEAKYGTKKPSELVALVRESNELPILSSVDLTPTQLRAPFEEVATFIKNRIDEPHSSKRSWYIAADVLREVEAAHRARNLAATGNNPVTAATPPALPEDKTPEELRARWVRSIPARKKTIEALYRRLLAAEAAVQPSP